MTYKKTGRGVELALIVSSTPKKKPAAIANAPTHSSQPVQSLGVRGPLAGGHRVSKPGTSYQDALGTPPAPNIERDDTRSTDRLNLRVSPAVKGLLEQGAALKGLTLTDYITATMVETARQDIARSMRRRLSAQDTARLMELLQEEGREPTERMQRAAERYNEMVSGAVR